MQHHKIIIIGGGPAGSSAATKLVEAGEDIAIIDRKEFPRLKLCGGWVTPEAMERLNLKMEDYPHRIINFKKMIIHIGSFNFSAGVEQYSISRIEFDKWLLERSKAPVILDNIKKIEEKNGKYLLNDTYSCDYLIGAGGTACPVQRSFFKRSHKERRHIVTRELEYDAEVKTQDCHLFWPRKLNGYGWYVPKADGRINIGVGGSHRDIKSIDEWWHFIEKECLKLGLIDEPIGKPKSHAYYLNARQADNARIGNVFIVGDSLGLATIDLAEGIEPAIESGHMAANSILTKQEYNPDAIKKYSLPWGAFLRRVPMAPVLKV